MDRKKFLVIGLLGFFMISMFAGVMAQESTWWENMFGEEGDKFLPGLFGGDVGQSALAKILLTTLIVLLVYSIASFMPFLDKSNMEGIRWTFSIVVGVLSFMFVSFDTVEYILTTYEALGVALTTIIPLIILFTFMWKLHETHEVISNLIYRPVYGIFTGYMIWKLLRVLSNDGRYVFVQGEMAMVVIAIILGAGAFLFGGYIQKKFVQEKAKITKENVISTVDKRVNYDMITAKAYEKLSNAEKKKLDFP